MSENDDEALRARAARLAAALKTAQPPPPPPQAPRAASGGAAMGLALRASSEIVAGVVVGGVVGWGLDRLLHTKPAFLVLFLLLGSVAGIANVIRSTSSKSGT